MTPWVQRLLILNIGVFFVTLVLPQVTEMFAYVPRYVLYRPWTIITYMFLHASPSHVAFNMLAFFIFGRRLEERLGGRRFLALYFLSGIMGAILSIPFNLYNPIVGASGAVYGVMMGFAMYWPRARIHVLGIVPLEAGTFVILLTMLSLYSGWQGGGNVAHFAHLGGFLGGFLYLKWWERTSPAAKFKAKAQPKKKTKTIGEVADIRKWQRINRDDMHPENCEELDRILEKINDSGVASLTTEEREFLDRFSTR